MTNQDNKINMLSNIAESSIAGLFQGLLSKKSGSDNPTLKLGDSEGSDFKRLMNKKKYKRISNTDEDTMIIQTSLNQQQQQQQQSQIEHKKYHSNSPDFRPVVYLTNTDTNVNSGLFSGRFFSLFSPRKDRYFNNDREELSKDIFPVGS